MIMAVDLLASVEYKYNIDKLVINNTISSNSLNVKTSSKVIYGLQGAKVLQSEVLFTGILGGFVGKYIKHHMDIEKVKSDIIWAEVETPHKVIIFDEQTNEKTIIKQTKQTIDKILWRKVVQKSKINAEYVKTSILECRKLEEIHFDVYASLITRAKKYNVKTIITAQDKEVLESVVEASPYGMVFNEKQLELMGFETGNIEELVKQLVVYLKKGVHYIGVDLKEEGTLLLSPNKLCYVEPLINPKSNWSGNNVTGAYLGGIAVGVDRKYEQEKTAKLAHALALASWENENYNKSNVDKLFNKVKVRELSTKLYNEK